LSTYYVTTPQQQQIPCHQPQPIQQQTELATLQPAYVYNISNSPVDHPTSQQQPQAIAQAEPLTPSNEAEIDDPGLV
jgi:hypothetical protein